MNSVNVKQLSKCQTKPVLLSLISPYADSYVLPSRNIPAVMSLFDKKYLDLSYNDLVKVCQSIQIDITKEQIERVQIDTINQAKGNSFFRHRAGRIGASQSKAAASTNPSLPSQSLIQNICYPELNKVTTKRLYAAIFQNVSVRYLVLIAEIHALRRSSVNVLISSPWFVIMEGILAI